MLKGLSKEFREDKIKTKNGMLKINVEIFNIPFSLITPYAVIIIFSSISGAFIALFPFSEFAIVFF